MTEVSLEFNSEINSGCRGELGLPTELCIQIMQNLDYKSLLTCTQVCKSFRHLITTTLSLQYIIELAVARQVDNPDCMDPTATRLETLRRHQLAWENVAWSREYKIRLDSRRLLELYGGIIGQATQDGTIEFHQLPSDLRSIEEKSWTIIPDFGSGIVTFRDFTMDPSQDILVLLEIGDWNPVNVAPDYYVHLRSLTTGEDHPLAKNTSKLSFPGPRNLDTRRTQILGDYIMLLLSSTDEPHNLLIWNWQTGILLLNINGTDIDSASLLTDDWVVCCILGDDGQLNLSAVNFKKESTIHQRCDLDSLTNVVTLTYPRFADDVNLAFTDIRCDHGQSWKSRHTDSTPFYRDSREFILIVTFVVTRFLAERSFIHFIPSNHLLSMANASCDLPATKSWESWGVSHTRLLMPRLQPPDTWYFHPYGTRFTLKSYTINNSGLEAWLLDFNSLANRKTTAHDGSMTDLLQDTFFPLEAVQRYFDEPVTTMLPYLSRSYRLEDSDSHDDNVVMCSEDNLILVDETLLELRILVF